MKAYNWVGVSPDTVAILNLIVAAPTNAEYSSLEGSIFLLDVNGDKTGEA